MNGLLILIPAALTLGGLGLVAFIWSLNGNQYEDLDGEAERILFDQPACRPTSNPRDPESQRGE